MKTLEIILWLSIGIVFYTYIGYGIILFVMVKIKKAFRFNKSIALNKEDPEITLLVAAYNEKDNIKQKVLNSYALNYPKNKLKLVWVTDGSDDGTPNLLKEYPNIKVYHSLERKGKTAAINRVMPFIKTPIVVFSDANTILNENAIKNIADAFKDTRVGCVSGEKRIHVAKHDNASSSGEGLYWKYESFLKKLDSEFYSAVGAAGELFAIRTALYSPIENDTLLDDFMISLRIAMKGYQIKYTPDAYAIELASANIEEEMKRKVRIAAGGFQSMWRLIPLLNILKFKVLSFQYVSHRVLRWSIAPFLLPLILTANIALIYLYGIYKPLLLLQTAFYLLALIGQVLQNKTIKMKLLFVPFYFSVMNVSVYKGFIMYLRGQQSTLWEKAQRKAK